MIQMCDVIEDLDYNLNHLPSEIIVDLSFQNATHNTRYSYDQTNTKIFNNTLSSSLLLTPATTSILEILDTYMTQLIHAIFYMVHVSTSQNTSNVQETAGFDEFCKTACVKINKAKRYLKEKIKQDLMSRRTKQAYVTYQKTRICKKRLVQSMLRQYHQKQIEKGTKNTHKTWKLVQ